MNDWRVFCILVFLYFYVFGFYDKKINFAYAGIWRHMNMHLDMAKNFGINMHMHMDMVKNFSRRMHMPFSCFFKTLLWILFVSQIQKGSQIQMSFRIDLTNPLDNSSVEYLKYLINILTVLDRWVTYPGSDDYHQLSIILILNETIDSSQDNCHCQKKHFYQKVIKF